MNNKIIVILLGAILAVGIGVFIVGLRPEVQPNITIEPTPITLRGAMDINEFYTGTTSTVISISTTTIATGTSITAMAANSGRLYARIQNIGNTMITCQLNPSIATSTLVSGTGIILNSSTTNSIYEINPNNLYKGLIRCISENSTGTISVVEI